MSEEPLSSGGYGAFVGTHSFGYVTISRAGKMSDGPNSISRIFGASRPQGISENSTFFQINEQPIFFVGPTTSN
jgi:hypothetical protein